MILVLIGCKTTQYRSDRCLTDSIAPYDNGAVIELKRWIVNHNCDFLKACKPEEFKKSKCAVLEAL